MKLLRRLLVKYCALSYRVNIFGSDFSYLRVTTLIMPSFCLFAVLCSLDYTLGAWIAGIWLALTVYIGFLYFNFYPVSWGELDNYQKLVYGDYDRSKLSKEELKELEALVNLDSLSSYHRNLWLERLVALINPAVMVLSMYLIVKYS